jgi:NAD(P)H-flavin reductase/CheY-like chemotaxis protein
MKNNSILIVDDEAIVRESLRDWLVNAGFDVSAAESAEDALKLISKKDFSVLVLDIRLPGRTGLSVLKEVKAQRPWVKSMIITAYPSDETMKEATRLGAVDYVVKPLAPEDLEHMIRDCIESIGKEPTVITPPKVARKPGEKVGELKKSVVVSKSDFKNLVNNLIKSMDVYGVKSKRGKYVYDNISKADDLALDYDITVTPPTMYLLPARETILKFKIGNGDKPEPVTDKTSRVIIGVHPYDVRAIEMLDEAFMSTNPDPDYIARRQNTLIIGVENLNPSPKSFASSMGTHIAENTYDLMLTDLGSRYMVAIGSKKGADLIKKYTSAHEPTADDIAIQKTLLDEALNKYKLHLDVPRERLPKLLEDSYDDPFWQTRSEKCLSCGSCVMVCPTCFCFDVQDDVALNLKEGQRVRQRDACMLVDFAKVATGENFRHDKASRFRHRIYRKGKYVLERYGRMGCVGCGRCAVACLAEIASPVEAFNAIAASWQAKHTAQRVLRETYPESELYTPRLAQVVRVDQLAAKEKVFEVKFTDGKGLGHQPGQFISASILGIGESPFGVASSPTRPNTFEFAVRNVGSVTNALHNLKKGDVLGIRGPFGNGFNVKYLEGKDILFIAGGIGLFPVRSLIQYVMDKRKQFGRAIVLFGARTPAERLFVDELAAWKNSPDLEFYETVDRGTPEWTGNVGVITTLIPKVQLDPRKTVAIVVGPPIMYRFVISELKKKDLADENIIMSLERRMKCGVGKCGHCQINGVYVCQEGPVFSLAQLRNLREAV